MTDHAEHVDSADYRNSADHRDSMAWQLCDADQAAVDTLFDDQIPDTDADPARVERVQQVVAGLDHLSAGDPPDDLVKRTLERIEQSKPRPFERPGPGAGFGLPLRFAELGAVAAMLLIGISLLWPVMEMHRASARQIACANNLGQASIAMSRYAMDDRQGALPSRQARPGSPWWQVGESVSDPSGVRSNSANLYVLVEKGYISPNRLACPDNPHAMRNVVAGAKDWPTNDSISYSYQSQYTHAPIRLADAPQLAVLADRNPLFAPGPSGLVYRQSLGATPTSRAHGGRGHNIMFADGAVSWSASPVLPTGDNIWLVNGVDNYTGTESPSAADDAFLIP